MGSFNSCPGVMKVFNEDKRRQKNFPYLATILFYNKKSFRAHKLILKSIFLQPHKHNAPFDNYKYFYAHNQGMNNHT